MEKRTTDNRLLERAVIKAMPAGALAMMGFSVAYMVDFILAGAFFSPTHIACVGLALPYAYLAFSLVNVTGSGAMLAMTNCIGRGDKEGSSRYYSMIFTLMCLIGLLFIALTLIFSRQIVVLFGARGEDVILPCSAYLCAYSPCILLTAANYTLCGVLRAFGYNKEALIVIIVTFFTNVGFSLLLILCTDIGFASLGFGTALSHLTSVALSLAIIARKHFGLKIRLFRYRRDEISTAFKLGLPSSGDMISDSISSGIVNNIIMAGLGVLGVATYAVAKNIYNMVNWAVGGMGLSATPLYGLLFGSRDRNGLRRVFLSNIRYGLLYSLIWSAIVIACMPVLMNFYGVNETIGIDPETVRTGVYCMMAFIPVVILNSYQLERIFEATERFRRSLLLSIMPDSILFPLLLLLLLEPWGYTGLWLSYGFSYLLLLLGYFTWQSVRNRRRVRSVDDILDLPQDIRENVPRFDVSINSKDEAIAGLSSRIEAFLKAEGFSDRVACMTALCMEELAVDMTANAKKSNGILDVRMFVDTGLISVCLRNSASPYNPLNFAFDKQDFSKIGVFMAQKTAEKIEYRYVYKMNIVTITIKS